MSIILSPVAGTLVDQFPRRWMMVFSDLGAGIATGVIAILLAAGDLTILLIYAITISSCFSAFQWPAYTAATTLLVPPPCLASANGMLQIGEAVGRLFNEEDCLRCYFSSQLTISALECIIYSVVTLLNKNDVYSKSIV